MARKAKRRTRTSRVTNHTAQIGRFDGELKTVAFHSGDKVQDLVTRSGLTVHDGEELNDAQGNTVALTDTAKAQEYFLTGNYKNGTEEETTEELSEDEKED